MANTQNLPEARQRLLIIAAILKRDIVTEEFGTEIEEIVGMMKKAPYHKVATKIRLGLIPAPVEPPPPPPPVVDPYEGVPDLEPEVWGQIKRYLNLRDLSLELSEDSICARFKVAPASLAKMAAREGVR